MDIYEIIEKIKQRPGMYLGAEDLSYFSRFIDGYFFCLKENEYLYEKLYPLPFHEFFQSYYRIKCQETRNLSYDTMILEECGGNQKKALRYFFEILEVFKQEAHITGCSICRLSEDNIHFHQTNDRVIKRGVYTDDSWVSQPIYTNVDTLYHIAFSYGADILIPVSTDKNTFGNLFYHMAETDSPLKVFENLDQHMERCFGEVVWHPFHAADEHLLLLLNDYIFHDKKTSFTIQSI